MRFSIEERKMNRADRIVCLNCGNNDFRVYIENIIDDASLYCSKCGSSNYGKYDEYLKVKNSKELKSDK
jgi:predicted nucleic-acid-binding Zn-ribbon protein